jgi:transposase
MNWHGVGSLVKLEGRFDSISYQQLLENYMIPDAATLIGEDLIFQQDNASIHTSRSTRQWLREHNVTLLEWPPKSPDANPIENLWRDLKTAANQRQPTTADELWNALLEAWQQILPASVQTLVECSTPSRGNTEGERWEHQILTNRVRASVFSRVFLNRLF